MAMPTFERLTKIFYSPTEVFKNLRFHPCWLIAILLTATIAGVYEFVFVKRITPERVANYQAEKMKESGVSVDKIEQARKKSIKTHTKPLSLLGSFIGGFVGRIIICCFLGAVFFGLVLLFGGKINFWQSLSIAAYSFLPITIIQKVSSIVLLYFFNPANIHPVLGTSGLLPDNLSFLVSSSENPLLFTFASYLSVLGFYWLWLMAKGLRNTGSIVSAKIGWLVAGIVWFLSLLPIALSAAFS